MTELAEQDVPCCKNAENYEMCARFVKAFEIIGKKWNGLIISSLCDTKAMRFRDLAHAVGACSDRVLVERLRDLFEAEEEKEGKEEETNNA